MVSLRKQNRHNAMRRTQRAAMPLFIDRGFDAVTVTEIATEVEIAASTIYRHFTTKEAIVLWDEHEQAIDDALDKTLRSLPPLDAMRVAFVDVFGDRYENDLGFQLQRVTYIYNTPQVHAAAIEADLKDREELEAGLRHFLSKKDRSSAPLLAGSAMLALDVAFDEWQKSKGKQPLSELIDQAFRSLSNLGSIG